MPMEQHSDKNVITVASKKAVVLFIVIIGITIVLLFGIGIILF